jgi:hypothetical protein
MVLLLMDEKDIVVEQNIRLEKKENTGVHALLKGWNTGASI